MQENFVTVAHSQEKIPQEIPTVSIKKFSIDSNLTPGTLVSSVTPTEGKRGLLVNLHLATNTEAITYALADRNGTFDGFRLGTQVAIGAKSEILLQGDITKPIHTIEGTFALYIEGGAATSGSFIYGYEIVKK